MIIYTRSEVHLTHIHMLWCELKFINHRSKLISFVKCINVISARLPPLMMMIIGRLEMNFKEEISHFSPLLSNCLLTCGVLLIDFNFIVKACCCVFMRWALIVTRIRLSTGNRKTLHTLDEIYLYAYNVLKLLMGENWMSQAYLECCESGFVNEFAQNLILPVFSSPLLQCTRWEFATFSPANCNL